MSNSSKRILIISGKFDHFTLVQMLAYFKEELL